MRRLFTHDRLPAMRKLAIVPPFAWLALFLLVPFLLVLKISFADLRFGIRRTRRWPPSRTRR